MANVTRALAAGAIAPLWVAAACEIAFPVYEVEGDGGVDASSEVGVDADAQQREAIAPDGCDATATFGAPSLLVFANFPYAVYSPHLSPDERNVYFQSPRDQTTNDLFGAQRGGASGPFDTPVALDSVNSPEDDGNAMVSADGRFLFFTSNRINGADDYDVFMATRDALDASFGGAFSLPINSNATEAEPFLRADELFFTSTRSGQPRIYRSLFVDGAAGPPAPLSEVAPDVEAMAAVSADGLTLYIASTRDGGQGFDDIWVARRASVGAPFSVFTNVIELNSPVHDAPGWLSPDNCRIYFSSDRPGGPSAANLYVAERRRE